MAPFGFWWLGPVSLGLFFYLLMNDRGRGLLLGWLYGLGAYGIGVSWVYVSIHEHGNAAPALAALMTAVFVAGMALFSMFNGWLFVRLAQGARSRDSGDDRWLRGAAWFVIALIGVEWLLNWFLTGFPWLAAGYGQLDGPLSGFAPLGGVSLISAMTAIAGVALVLLWRAFSVTAVVMAVTPWLLGSLLGQINWTDSGAKQTVALVQGNITQATKWLPENRLPIVQHYRSLTEPHWGKNLIVWPEAAITVFEHQAEDLLRVLDKQGSATGSGIVLGLPAMQTLADGSYAFLNAARGLGAAEGRYVKRRLVPFGEYVPFEGVLRGAIEFFNLPMSHARSGEWRQAPLKIGEATASMAICYEIVYSELVREDVDVLLTISNDTWFGDSIGPPQHLAIARMRALENGRWLLRATNNGLTAIVDAQGTVRAQLPQFEAGVLTGEYRLMSGRTPFNRVGPWPLYGILLLIAGLLIAPAIRQVSRQVRG